jgi:hypothetical protein
METVNNVIIMGVTEETDLVQFVINMFEDLGIQKPSREKVEKDYEVGRIGRAREGVKRPIRMKLDRALKRDLMMKKRDLNKLEDYRTVYLKDDKTYLQRKIMSQDREQRACLEILQTDSEVEFPKLG